MKEELILLLAGWTASLIINAGIRYSKSTKNTVDDFIFEGLHDLKNGVLRIFKFKK